MSKISGICIGGPLHGQQISNNDKKFIFNIHPKIDASNGLEPFDPYKSWFKATRMEKIEYTFDPCLRMWLFQGVIVPRDNLPEKRSAIKISLLFAWYDLWVGAFWDRKSRKLYILPLPCVGVVIQFPS